MLQRWHLAYLLTLLLAWSGASAGQSPPQVEGYVADIELQTVDEFRQLLKRVDEIVLNDSLARRDPVPVAFVLHGPVVRNLLRSNYLANKETVDLAARLSALGQVDIKACRTWMTLHDVDPGDLQPFISIVRLGREEVDRLVNESRYVYF